MKWATNPIIIFSVFVFLGLVVWGNGQQTNPVRKVQPKLEPIAETRLLMEGLAHANFRGLERILSKKPEENQQWLFARGQALLIAETANLLMLRPPKNQGQPVWFERAMELRTLAGQLAQMVAQKDFEGSRAALQTLANSCNKCHQSFQTPVHISPFAEKIDDKNFLIPSR